MSRFGHFCQARRLHRVEAPSGFEGCGGLLRLPMERVRGRLVKGSVGRGRRGIGAQFAAGALRVSHSSLLLRPQLPARECRHGPQTHSHTWPFRGPRLPSRSLLVSTQIILTASRSPPSVLRTSVLPFPPPSVFLPTLPPGASLKGHGGPSFPEPGRRAVPSPTLLRVWARPAVRLLHAACLRPARAAPTLATCPLRDNVTVLLP